VTISEQVLTTDVLVIGAGIAGSFAAIRARELGAEVIIAEQGVSGFVGRSTTGTNIMRVVLPEDDLDAAVRGTVLQTDYMVDQEYCEEAIGETYERFQELISLGAGFQRDFTGKIKWMMMDTEYPEFKQREAIWSPFGSYKHLMKFKARALQLGVRVVDRTVITDLLLSDGSVCGAVGVNRRSGEFYVFRAKAVVMATAECHAAAAGNTPSLTGDGIAIALRAGAKLRGMEFGRIGFGPIFPQGGKPMTMPEIMERNMRKTDEPRYRMVNACGEEFLERYENLYRKPGRLYGGPCWKSYIPAVIRENKEGRGPCYWVLGSVRFEIGYTSQTSSQNGGIRIDKNGRTTLLGLYAGGTASDMCGAIHFSIPYNLMGSHITGRRAGEQAAKFALENPMLEAGNLRELRDAAYAPLKRETGITEEQIRLELIEAWPYADYRTDENLCRAYRSFRNIEIEASELMANEPHELVKCLKIRNMIQVAQAEVLAARTRTESRIEHYRDDYPLMNNIDWLKWVIVSGTGENMRTETETIPLELWKYRPEPTMVDRLEPRKEANLN